MIETKERETFVPSRWRKPWARAVMRCGWCKGFIHEELQSNMQRYVHDERPRTDHEVLPYRSE